MKKLSVIIPLFNAESYISETITTVLDQKNIDIECIVVDDSSTDNSADIVQQYPVIYFKKQNGGASSARNFGLRHATGEYIMFIDADDYLSDNTICSRCIQKIEEERLDFCLFTYQYFNDKTNRMGVSIKYPLAFEGIYDSDILIPEMVQNGYFPASPCFRVLRRDFVENNELYFKEGTTSEDILWYTKVLCACKRFATINSDAYKYRKGIDASVTGSCSIQKCENFADVLNDAVKIVEANTFSVKRESLLSALYYEYLILLSISNGYITNIELYKKLYSLRRLNNYTMFPRSKYVSVISKLLGIRAASKLLYLYSSKNAKSRV